MDIKEQSLIESSCGGDLSAFNRLVEAYQDQVFNLCLRLLSQKEMAEDATQEAFLSAYQHLSSFRGGSFRAWLMRIATNACYDELRKRRSRPSSPLDDDLLLPSSERNSSPEKALLRKELAGAIQAALLALPGEQRLALILSDIYGFSYEEIAQATGAPLGTVKSRIARGRMRVRDHLKQQRELLADDWRLTVEE